MEEGKIRYDCRNLKYINNRRMVCIYGVKLSLAKDGGVDAKYILRGESPKMCQDCGLYVKGELVCS